MSEGPLSRREAFIAEIRESMPALARRLDAYTATGNRRRLTPIQKAERILGKEKPHPQKAAPPAPSRQPAMLTAVKRAVLELLAVEPLTDSDLVDGYRAAESEKGWPPAAAATIRNCRARLTRAGHVTQAGTVPGLNGQQRKLWTLAQ